MRALFVVYLIGLHIAVIGPAVRRTPVVRDQYVSVMLSVQRWQGWQVAEGSDIFLGDSITQGLVASNVSARAVNFGVGWQTIDGLTKAIPNYKSLANARSIYLMIGANDLLDGKQLDFSALLLSLPDKPLVWSGIPGRPTEPIRGLCAVRPKCRFADTSDLSLQSDGVHLTETGYRAWTERLKRS